ncbi:s-adenosyl-l-methionine-dependent methyltransferases superfamily protein [Plasmopara halstedii]|uniref:tRNA (adenine(58)-N(1))-methyltransferase n=1 Tax=Plasmopara halstedii TaxID=4781 RepID=A0A0P1AB29_PLAHL|nr:s-adenosyl-l-methionine-dependent methyltransferases superfamily protein [Plasmopara halstedii]CEG38010.1 s-adenosyl-l-methionine-dependent methyltransferases superfamily protein [Plasmopara halstedii]|eukprot:XP_024574379.1 s-adenosyl-l-methionine-dependent methyltransferases superfamily protein [Plasmopara halstedii]
MAMPSADVNAASVTTISNSMWKSSLLISEGSLVILFETHNSLTYCYAQRDAIYQNRHGAFYHNDMIGQPFGSKIISRKKNARGYLILLAPTPELWSRALRHRTQIVFTLDASAIQFTAALCSGARVVESGTGSGALTTSFARTVSPNGHVFSFEFNAHRADIAREEFHRNGLTNVITVDCRDACEQGFPTDLDNSIDLVFLDLPCPWKAVGHATKVLKQGGFFASYSPCIEQVQKTCDALRSANFELIRTIETRLVPYNSRRIDLPVPDFGFGKKVKTENGSASSTMNEQDINSTIMDDETEGKSNGGRKRKYVPGGVGEHIVAKKDDEIRGHTAYLTFATKFFE